jgi:hypothetical protein
VEVDWADLKPPIDGDATSKTPFSQEKRLFFIISSKIRAIRLAGKKERELGFQKIQEFFECIVLF